MNKPGDTFGGWTLIKYIAGTKKPRVSCSWLCRCSCGELREVRYDHLRSKRSTSCGHDIPGKKMEKKRITLRKESNRRILSHDVGDALAELGRCSMEELQLQFPDCTRYQLQNALSAASRRGTVVCLQHGLWGSVTNPSTVRTKPTELRAIPSVFHLASGPVRVPTWRQPVREHLIHGEW